MVPESVVVSRRIKTSPSVADADRDGRARRALATRQRIIDSMAALIREGIVAPTCEQVAAGAGISPRSVFLHFDDLQTLFEEVYGTLTEAVMHRRAVIPATVPLETRLRMYASVRGQIGEHFGNFSRTAMVMFHHSPRIQEMIALARRTMRETVTTYFGAELAGLAEEDAQRLTESIVATTTWETWSILRRDFDYPVEAAEEAFAATVRGLLLVAGISAPTHIPDGGPPGTTRPPLTQVT